MLQQVMSANKRFWWVNQRKTFNEEFSGGYIWSPKRKSNDTRNPYYENMQSVKPGDIVFSYREGQIVAISTAISSCYDAQKPEEFGASGENWDSNGWKVDLKYTLINHPISPTDHEELIAPLLPAKYSPLHKKNCKGRQLYLAEISNDLAAVLLNLLQKEGNEINLEAKSATEANYRDQDNAAFEEKSESDIRNAAGVSSTEKEQLIKSRQEQGLLRKKNQKFGK